MPSSSTAYRVALPAVLTSVVLYALWSSPSPHELEPAADDADAEQRLSIRWVQPVEAHPGEAVIVEADGVIADQVLAATVSTQDEKTQAKILRRDEGRVVVQLPRDLPAGTLKLRLYQGDRKSKPRLLQVRPTVVQELARNVLGGLAFVVIGLSLVARAFRHSADQRLRNHLTAMTQSRLRSTGLGAMIGAFTQSTTGSAGIMVGMLRARLLHGHAALAVLLGAQFGAATAGALLPLFASREALWVVVLGVLWTFAAGSRWARALGHIVLGCGVLFLGLSFMQDGLRPLLSEPALLPLVHRLAEGQDGHQLSCIALGAALAALLQGPGPAFAVVIALTQSTSLLSLTDGLLILSGTALGTSVGTLAVSFPIGTTGRRLALGHLAIGVISLTVIALGTPIWRHAANVVLGTDAEALRYGSRVLRPAMAAHLGLAFVLAQLASVALCLPLLSLVDRLSARLLRARVPIHEAQSVPSLRPVLMACRTAILALGKVVATRDRAFAVEAERAIGDARSAVTALLNQLADNNKGSDSSVTMANLTVCLHLSTATDGALRVAERALESDLAMHDAGAKRLSQIQALLVEGIECLVAYADGAEPLHLEDIQVREIRLNALEAETRAATAAPYALSSALWVSELSSACEAIGNHIYRLGTTLLTQRAQALNPLTSMPPRA